MNTNTITRTQTSPLLQTPTQTPGPPEHDLTIKQTLPLPEQIEINYENFFRDTTKSIERQKKKKKTRTGPIRTRSCLDNQPNTSTTTDQDDEDEPMTKSQPWTDEVEMELERQKRTGNSDEFLTPTKTAKAPKKPRIETTNTQNKFDALRKPDQDIQGNLNSISNKEHKTRTWIPPIVLPYAITNYNKLIQDLRQTLKHDNFYVR